MTAHDSASVDDSTAIELWGRVMRGFQATNRRLHAESKAKFELNEAEVETLLTLFRCPERRARHSALANGAGFSPGGFTKIADKLSERGLTLRADCPEDRRGSYLALTDRGLELAAELTTFAAQANRAHFIEVIGPERAQLVAEAMTLLYRANHETER